MKQREVSCMKKFLRGLLTIALTFLLIALGIVLSFKTMLINTADQMIKREMTHQFINTMQEQNSEVDEEAIKKIKETIEKNETIQDIMNTYFDQVIEILGSEEELKINITEDLNTLVDEGEKILKEYGITITPAEKEELLDMVSMEEVNTLLNETLAEAKQNLPEQIKEEIKIYQFVMGPTFKVMLCGVILLDLLFIALLKKSAYKWLSNLGGSSLIVGLFIGFVIPLSIDKLLKTLDNENLFAFNTEALANYGYVLIGIGIVAYVLEFTLNKTIEKKPIETQKEQP